MMIIGILYGLFLITLLSCFTLAKECDEGMEETMKYLEAQKRLEAYTQKR